MPHPQFSHTSYPVTIDSDEGPILTTTHNGQRYFGGVDGQRYTISIANETARRVEAVVTVDGLSVIDGKPGAFTSRGMVIDAYWRTSLDGTSLDVVRAFRICADQTASYTATSGASRSNVGIVGVAIFEEKKLPAPSLAVMKGATRGAGTSMGEERHSPVSMTAFERASSQPVSVTTFRYDTIAALTEAGILSAFPNAFPGNAHQGFCKP